MKQQYQSPQVYSFSTRLSILQTVCHTGTYDAFGGELLDECGPCDPPGCGYTGFPAFPECPP